MMSNFFKKIISFLFFKKDNGIVINPGVPKIIRQEYTIQNRDFGFPENPKIGQTYKFDGFFVQFKLDDGRKFKKQFTQEFIFTGKRWIQAENKENTRIEIGEQADYGTK